MARCATPLAPFASQQPCRSSAHEGNVQSAGSGSTEALMQVIEGSGSASDRKALRMVALRYANDSESGYSRMKMRAGFSYRDASGKRITAARTLRRILSLRIPPAWEHVWICADEAGHLQATGRDSRGRKQYRYHDRWRAMRDEHKFGTMLEFGRRLPMLRLEVDRELRRRELDRCSVTALVIGVLDRTLLRVGNTEYRRDNQSYGLTTLGDDQAELHGNTVVLRFLGKSGQHQEVSLTDARLVRHLRRCQELPGQELFQFADASGTVHPISSGDVNAFLESALQAPFTSKDFRTWGATAQAVASLQALPATSDAIETERNLVEAVKAAASRLGNTPAVCRHSYIHPSVIDAYRGGRFAELWNAAATCSLECSGMRPEELRLLALLEALEKMPNDPGQHRR
jgi:DNA topoisomerase-1